jgi:hypothetical protein
MTSKKIIKFPKKSQIKFQTCVPNQKVQGKKPTLHS